MLLGVMFLFVLAANRGWFGPGARVASGVVVAALLVGVGALLKAKYGQYEAAVAAVATGIAAGYATLTAATMLYDMVPAWGALLAASGIAAGAAVIAVRWKAELVAVLGLLGALTAPALFAIDEGVDARGTAFALLVFVGAAGVAVWMRWTWLLALAAADAAAQVLGLIAAGDVGRRRGDRRLARRRRRRSSRRQLPGSGPPERRASSGSPGRSSERRPCWRSRPAVSTRRCVRRRRAARGCDRHDRRLAGARTAAPPARHGDRGCRDRCWQSRLPSSGRSGTWPSGDAIAIAAAVAAALALLGGAIGWQLLRREEGLDEIAGILVTASTGLVLASSFLLADVDRDRGIAVLVAALVLCRHSRRAPPARA